MSACRKIKALTLALSSDVSMHRNPGRIAENFNVFDFELTAEQMARIDGLDTGARSGPDPDVPRPEVFDWVIPEN